MKFTCKTNLGILFAVIVVLAVICAYSCSLNSRFLSTGLIDDDLKEQLRERPYLTPQEYEEILQRIQHVLDTNPDDLSANLLKAELEVKPIMNN